MLYIVGSYYCMHFQGKLMNQTCENGKKPSFCSDFGHFGPNMGPQIFFSRILLLLDVRHCCKSSLYAISRKTNEQNLRKWQEKPSFVPDFGLFDPNLNHQFFFFSKIWICQSLDIMVSYHHVQYQKKLIILRELSDGQMDGREWFHRMLSN